MRTDECGRHDKGSEAFMVGTVKVLEMVSVVEIAKDLEMMNLVGMVSVVGTRKQLEMMSVVWMMMSVVGPEKSWR